jgi:multisubunit Na+/H+ antiporter MnhB subunit
LDQRKYGLHEFGVMLLTAAAAVLLFLLPHGWFKVVAVVPLVMLALVLAYGSLPRAWKTWVRIAQFVVMPVGLMLLTLGFIFGVGLTALLTRVFRVKMLDMTPDGRASFWVQRPHKEATLEKAERQF